MKKNGTKQLAKNKKAYHDYFIEEKFEAGIELTGTEIKSIRKGNVNLKDSYAYIKGGELFVSHMHISPYEQGNIFNVDPIRDRRLLVTKREINKLIGLIKQQGLTLVPINLYFKGKWAKMTIGVGKGKKLYDKRQDIAKRSAEKEMAIRLKERQQM